MTEQPRPVESAAIVPPLREVHLGPVLGQSHWVAEVQRPDGLLVRLSAQTSAALVQLLMPARSC